MNRAVYISGLVIVMLLSGLLVGLVDMSIHCKDHPHDSWCGQVVP